MAYCDEHKLRMETSKNNCDNIKDVKQEIDDHIWPSINNRPKISTLITITVIVFGILGGSFSLLYTQGQRTSEKVEAQGIKMTDKIDNLAECLRQDIRRIENQQMVIQGSMMKSGDVK